MSGTATDDAVSGEAAPFVRRLAKPVSAAEVARRLPGAVIRGDGDLDVQGICALTPGAARCLAFCDAAHGAERIASSLATVVIVNVESAAAPRRGQVLIGVVDEREAFIDTVAALLHGSDRPASPRASIGAGSVVDATATIEPTALVGADVHIGARSTVAAGAVIHDDTRIGDDCVIGPHAVVGHVGLAYHDCGDGRRLFFPHLAGVRIGNRVDVGAQTCVCRGMLSHTEIHDDAKIGSLVYVSHGVVIGRRAWLSAGAAIAGHARIDDDALLGIGSVVVDNVAIGAGTIVGGGSVVTRDAAAGARLLGVPAHAVATMRRFGPTPRN